MWPCQWCGPLFPSKQIKSRVHSLLHRSMLATQQHLPGVLWNSFTAVIIPRGSVQLKNTYCDAISPEDMSDLRFVMGNAAHNLHIDIVLVQLINNTNTNNSQNKYRQQYLIWNSTDITYKIYEFMSRDCNTGEILLKKYTNKQKTNNQICRICYPCYDVYSMKFIKETPTVTRFCRK